MKVRIEKKKAYNTLHWHMDGSTETICYRRHQSKLENSRERRISAVKRRRVRRDIRKGEIAQYRKSYLQPAIYFNIDVDITHYLESMRRVESLWEWVSKLPAYQQDYIKSPRNRVHE